jgi:hypothetical protein
MKRALLLSLLIITCLLSNAQNRLFWAMGKPVVVAQFNLTSASQSIPGWINLIGNPDASVLTASDLRSGSAIGISTINSTNVNIWNGNGGVASATVTLSGSGHVLPTGLYISYFFHNGVDYAVGRENIEINGLNPSKTYSFEILSSRQGSGDARTTRFTCVDSAGSTNTTVVSGDHNGDFNAVFTGKRAKSNGKILLAVNRGTGFTFGYCNAIRIKQEN